ncbi:MAG: Methionyl-tRNA formyltransferase [Elusimicrobia bacterium]|nr:Methionyl-tRNA formyltransferase [Elusimicrobiota bacterium]
MVKVLFFGTPEIAVPFLHWLSQHSNVVGVVCRPDEPVGRGYELTPPPTKVFADKKGIPVFQPAGPWDSKIIQSLSDTQADIGIVVAYGRILPRSVFSIPKAGCVNIHFSLLPQYRGAAPMQWALINGENETGVSAFWIEEGLDSGPLFHQGAVSISPDDNATLLQAKLVPLGLRVLKQVIEDAEKGNWIRTPQTGKVSVAPLLKKEMGAIDWQQPSQKIVNLVRGLCEWPVAYTFISPRTGERKQLKILKSRVLNEKSTGPSGVITDAVKDQGLVVQTGEGQVLLLEVRPAGKKTMSAWSFWQGAGLRLGDKLG